LSSKKKKKKKVGEMNEVLYMSNSTQNSLDCGVWGMKARGKDDEETDCSLQRCCFSVLVFLFPTLVFFGGFSPSGRYFFFAFFFNYAWKRGTHTFFEFERHDSRKAPIITCNTIKEYLFLVQISHTYTQYYQITNHLSNITFRINIDWLSICETCFWVLALHPI